MCVILDLKLLMKLKKIIGLFRSYKLDFILFIIKYLFKNYVFQVSFQDAFILKVTYENSRYSVLAKEVY